MRRFVRLVGCMAIVAVTSPAASAQTSTWICSDAKPIDALTMTWDGVIDVHVKAWKGDVGSTLLVDTFAANPFDPVEPGEILSVAGMAGGPNDQVWEIFLSTGPSKIGESKFHISCSDDEMNGAEDCGKRQGNGKGDEAGLIDDWLLAGMSGNQTLDCASLGIDIEIDIKPGSELNPINLGGQGVIPVAILGSDSFDVAEVEPDTLAFGPSAAFLAHGNGPHFENVNGDGFEDLVAHFRTQETGIQDGDTEACLTGELLDATPFEACDTVLAFVPCGIGFELALLLPPLMWLRGRRRLRVPVLRYRLRS